MGDFNAPNTSWGYKANTKTGRLLEENIHGFQYTALNTPGVTTRTGTRAQVSTTPDLALHKGRYATTWENSHENLTSDHDILHITIQITLRKRRTKVAFTDWNKFRKLRQSTTDSEHDTLNMWTKSLMDTKEQATSPQTTSAPADKPDPHLLRLWKKRKRLLRILAKQPHNDHLRKKIENISIEAIIHAQTLEMTEWNDTCDRIQNTLHSKQTWHLLRALLGTKKDVIPTIEKHVSTKGINKTFEELQNLYIPTTHQSFYKNYTGPTNEYIDKDFTLAELNGALTQNNRKTTPGPDGITYTLLRNLPDRDKETLLDHINQHWNAGTLPDEWKTSHITMIPKPGKTATLSNLRPISLTSCVGKTMERLVLNRLEEHLEDTKHFPHQLIGYRVVSRGQHSAAGSTRPIAGPQATSDFGR
ncbi:hypothetical protein ISCGN_010710 [Ixodes scapularis]